ncbi:hypothetical protein PPEP_b0499 [Pseudoalteromonas peptidolytica F12-50-A1]|uniref:Uncharacterized protein n=1 Tax=Pseudoalteromonas peptidolytica F12-50-A1 TaxID=1315280 RepID=A0A8I0T6U5_9GAMM|nr:hypothetical protein [Pseudoalteromonas peptidolytica F12-50-A1]
MQGSHSNLELRLVRFRLRQSGAKAHQISTVIQTQYLFAVLEVRD